MSLQYLGPVLFCRCIEDLLRSPGARPVGPNANHPDQQHQDDNEHNRSGDAARHISKDRFGLAEFASEGASTLAVRIALLVLQTQSFVVAVVVTEV